MKVLITGASGFVGNAMSSWLTTHGLEAVGAVRQLPARAQVDVDYRIVGNLDACTDWHTALADVEGIIHCAARVHVMHETADDPLMAFRSANVAGTERLARQAAALGVKRLVFISSIKVNGEETAEGFNENDTPAPQDPYGQAKWEAEKMLSQVSKETGLEVVIVRPPLVYGPGVKGNLARLLNWVERGVPLPLAGIRNARSLIGIDNFTSALHACLTHPAAAGRTYLVRDGEDISTPELVRRLGRHLGKPARLFALPAPLLEGLAGLVGRRADVQRLTGSLIVDDSRIRSELGWVPPYTLDDGLELMARAWLNRTRTG
jgi:nucleoside-diphosphate-sugar epimerase